LADSEDAYTQERALLPEVVRQHVGAGQAWIADRNFCTTGFLTDLQARGAHGLIRERNLGESLDTIVDAEDWEPFRRASPQAMAAWLAQQAKRLDLARYRKTGRSTRTPAVKRTHDPGRTHFSVARTLQQRKVKSP